MMRIMQRTWKTGAPGISSCGSISTAILRIIMLPNVFEPNVFEPNVFEPNVFYKKKYNIYIHFSIFPFLHFSPCIFTFNYETFANTPLSH
jgi:hypothetical protein